MYANEKKINNLFIYWLSISLILIFFIIIVGGLTRLTNSGLSITEWELFKGILPPLNENTWNIYFEHDLNSIYQSEVKFSNGKYPNLQTIKLGLIFYIH